MGKTTAAPPDRAYIASNRSQWAFLRSSNVLSESKISLNGFSTT